MVPIARSESLARVLDAMTASDRPSAPLTRLAVELDDATRVAVRVHGQSVHVDVIADDAGRLDGAWRRDVAQGIKRHGLEYGRDGADANDGRGRRRDEPTPAIARDGGRRSRRFTIDLDTATPS